MSESIPSPSMSPSMSPATFRSPQGSIANYAPQSLPGLTSLQFVESVALPTLIIGIEPVLADGQATLATDASSESATTLWKVERRWSADPTLPTVSTQPTAPPHPYPHQSIAASPSDPSSNRAVRHVAEPLDESLRPLIRRFHNDATRFLEREVDRQSLAHVAAQIGDRLATVFDAAEWDLLERGGANADPPAFLVIESSDETVLGLPWELVRVRGTYVVREGRLDIVRSVTAPGGDAPSVIVRHPPAAPVRIHINVCAPELPGIPALRYEEESYRILQAMYVHEGVRVNDMGEVNDLLDAVRGDADAPPVDVVHFSGHGSPGVLHFESDTGDDDSIAVGDLIQRMRAHAAGRVPSLFYLASCHGHSTSAVDGWADQLSSSLRSTAALLHGAGVAQVVAHVGVIDDRRVVRSHDHRRDR